MNAEDLLYRLISFYLIKQNLEHKCLEQPLAISLVLSWRSAIWKKQASLQVSVLCASSSVPSIDTAWCHDRHIVQMPVNWCEIKHQLERQRFIGRKCCPGPSNFFFSSFNLCSKAFVIPLIINFNTAVELKAVFLKWPLPLRLISTFLDGTFMQLSCLLMQHGCVSLVQLFPSKNAETPEVENSVNFNLH